MNISDNEFERSFESYKPDQMRPEFEKELHKKIQETQHEISRSSRSRIFIWSAAAAVIICLVSVWFTITQPHVNADNRVFAQVIEGKVTVSDNLIRTVGEEKGIVKLSDKTIIHVNHNTAVEVIKLDQTKGTVLALIQGSASFDVNKQDQVWSVVTPAGVVGVIGTKFSVVLEYINSKGEKAMKKELLQGVAIALLLVSVNSGTVNVSNAYGSEKISAGDTAIVRQDKAPEKEKQLSQEKDYQKAMGEHKKICARLNRNPNQKIFDDLVPYRCSICKLGLGKGSSSLAPIACQSCAEKNGICPACGEKILQDQKVPDIQQLIDDLGSKDEKVRAKAEEELKKIGVTALEALEKETRLDKLGNGEHHKDCCSGKIHKDYLLDCFKMCSSLCKYNCKCPRDPSLCLHCGVKIGLTKDELVRKELVKKLADEIRSGLQKQLKELLEKLNSDDPKVRDEATSKIIELGKVAKSIVIKAVEEQLKGAKGNTEVELRCKKILEELKKGEISEGDKKWIKEGICDCGPLRKYSRPNQKDWPGVLCQRCKVERYYNAEDKLCKSCADKLGICNQCQKKK